MCPCWDGRAVPPFSARCLELKNPATHSAQLQDTAARKTVNLPRKAGHWSTEH